MAKVVMYSTPWCGYCASARELLRNKSVAFEDIDVSMDSTLRQRMTELSGRNTVPQVFINNEPVGGYTDLAALEQSGELDGLLAAPPAATE